MTRQILSDMDSEDVSSWDDTEESAQVARIIRATYFDLAARLDLPEHKDVFQLEASGNSAQPVLMTLPEDVVDLEWIKYDVRILGDSDPNWHFINWYPLSHFMDRVHNHNASEDQYENMTIVRDGDSMTFPFRNDIAPSIYTTLDERTLIFDSIDRDVDNDTLMKSKTWCSGLMTTTFTLADATVAELDDKLWPLFLAEATAACFAKLKQMQSVHDERTARRHLIASQKNKHNVPKDGQSLISQTYNYGKSPNMYSRAYNYGRR